MLTRPYDMTVSEFEFSQADAWWRSLSINQMKEYEQRHFPWKQNFAHKRMIHQMWEEEGKPNPQELIGV